MIGIYYCMTLANMSIKFNPSIAVIIPESHINSDHATVNWTEAIANGRHWFF